LRARDAGTSARRQECDIATAVTRPTSLLADAAPARPPPPGPPNRPPDWPTGSPAARPPLGGPPGQSGVSAHRARPGEPVVTESAPSRRVVTPPPDEAGPDGM